MKLPLLTTAATISLASGFSPALPETYYSSSFSSSATTTTCLKMTANHNPSRRSILQTSALVSLSSITGLIMNPNVSEARLEAVNRPDLLPTTSDEVIIQTEKFLTTGQAKRMSDLIRALERDTGFRLRVLCQAYPNTPGLAIRDYWSLGKDDQKDDKYIVLVVDQFGGKGNVLNFNVGDGVKFALPNVFWTRLSGKYGTVSGTRHLGGRYDDLIDTVLYCTLHIAHIYLFVSHYLLPRFKDIFCQGKWT